MLRTESDQVQEMEKEAAKIMLYSLVPFTHEYLQPAVALFIQDYCQERAQSPCLPSRAMDEPKWIQSALQSKLANPGVALVKQDRLLAYMVTGGQFAWKGQRAAIVPEYGHAAVADSKQALYQAMYQALAEEWVSRGCHLHLIGHFAHDALLQETLYQFGFGALVAERLRDGSAIDTGEKPSIKIEQEVGKLLDLHIEHIHYYPQSPIFLARSTDRQSALADLEAHRQDGDVFFVSYEQDKPRAYLIIGKSTIGGEGFLLQKTGTAQIKSAYVWPGIRGKGVGKALLHCAIQWSQQQGYERVFVEHETANLAGGNFWRKYFSPYLYFSMRYVDNGL